MNAEERDTMLKSIHENVCEIKEWKAALDERCKAHREKTDDLTETVFGNPGLKMHVQRLVNCKKSLNKLYDLLFGVLKTVIAGGILVFIFWLLNLYKLIG